MIFPNFFFFAAEAIDELPFFSSFLPPSQVELEEI